MKFKAKKTELKLVLYRMLGPTFPFQYPKAFVRIGEDFKNLPDEIELEGQPIEDDVLARNFLPEKPKKIEGLTVNSNKYSKEELENTPTSGQNMLDVMDKINEIIKYINKENME